MHQHTTLRIEGWLPCARALRGNGLTSWIDWVTLSTTYALLIAEEGEDEGLGEPLILRIDQDDQGSVGSEDTTRFDSDDDMPPIETGR